LLQLILISLSFYGLLPVSFTLSLLKKISR
jgi:hypothetical protein